MVLFDDLVKGTLIDDPYVARAPVDYFPTELAKRYAAVMPRHPLQREIVATGVVNHLVNHAGVAFLHRTMAATGADVGRVGEAYLEVDRAGDAASARTAVFATGLPIQEAHARLIAIEDGIAEAVLARLDGRKKGRT